MSLKWRGVTGAEVGGHGLFFWRVIQSHCTHILTRFFNSFLHQTAWLVACLKGPQPKWSSLPVISDCFIFIPLNAIVDNQIWNYNPLYTGGGTFEKLIKKVKFLCSNLNSSFLVYHCLNNIAHIPNSCKLNLYRTVCHFVVFLPLSIFLQTKISFKYI